MFHVKTDFYPNCLALAVNNSWQRVKKQVVYLCLLGQSEVVRRYLPFNLYNQVISGYSQKWSWGYLSIDFYNQKWSGRYLSTELYSQVISGYLYSPKWSGRYLSIEFYNQKWSGSYLTIDLYSQVIGGYLYSLKRSGRYLSFDLYSQVIGGYLYSHKWSRRYVHWLVQSGHQWICIQTQVVREVPVQWGVVISAYFYAMYNRKWTEKHLPMYLYSQKW